MALGGSPDKLLVVSLQVPLLKCGVAATAHHMTDLQLWLALPSMGITALLAIGGRGLILHLLEKKLPSSSRVWGGTSALSRLEMK